MADQSASHSGMRVFIIAACLVILVWGINQAQSVVVVFLVSVFLAVIGSVPVLWMEQKRIPTAAAVLIVVAAMIALLLGIGAVVGASINGFSSAMPLYQNRMQAMFVDLKSLLAGKGVALPDNVLLGALNPGVIMSLTAGLFSALSSVLSNIILILLTVTFILLEASSFPAKLRRVQDNPGASLLPFAGFVDDIKRYMGIKTLLNLVAGTLITIWLTILGVDFPVLWGFLAFLLQFIPSLGSIIAAVPAVLLALIQYGGGTAALTAAGYVAIGTILGNVIEPKIMGKQMGLSTLVVFLSLVFWGNLLGVIGALLCVPLTLTVKIACQANEDTRWIAVLLGPEVSVEAKPVVPKTPQ